MPSPDPATLLTLPEGEWAGPVPVPDLDTAPFWAGLREHRLAILRCADCRLWVHPPQASCPRCLSLSVQPETVSGRGVVYSFTVANREFAPGVKPPYVAALVDLEEQEGPPPLRLVTALVNLRIADVRIGMPVQPVFYDIDESTSLVYFEPTR